MLFVWRPPREQQDLQDGELDQAKASPQDQYECVKCKEAVPLPNTLSAGRTGRICKPCYNSCRALTEYYKKRGRKHEWDSMNQERKRRMIVENKGTGGRGKQRQLKITEEARGLTHTLRVYFHVRTLSLIVSVF